MRLSGADAVMSVLALKSDLPAFRVLRLSLYFVSLFLAISGSAIC